MCSGAHVCVCAWGIICSSVLVCACRGQRLALGVFLHPSLPSVLRQNVSPLRPELAYLANVVGQLALGTPSLATVCRTGGYPCILSNHSGGGNLNADPRVCMPNFYLLSHLISLRVYIFSSKLQMKNLEINFKNIYEAWCDWFWGSFS